MKKYSSKGKIETTRFSLSLSLSPSISLFFSFFSSFYSIACRMTRFDKIKRLRGRLFLIVPAGNTEGTHQAILPRWKEALSRHRLCAAPFAPRSHERTLEWSCASTRREALFNSLIDSSLSLSLSLSLCLSDFSTAIEKPSTTNNDDFSTAFSYRKISGQLRILWSSSDINIRPVKIVYIWTGSWQGIWLDLLWTATI